MTTKRRLSASIDADLVEAAERATARGESPSVSAWVNEALRLKVARDRRLRALEAFIADHETDHDEITPAEVREATRRAAARAVVVRDGGSERPARAGRRSARR